MNPLKKILIAFAAFCGFILIIALLFFLIMAPKIQPIGKLQLANINDGTYIGVCDNRIVKATVSVSVENHRLTDITILQHDNGMGENAEKITTKVLDAQSLDVDAVSGATYSSNRKCFGGNRKLNKLIIAQTRNEATRCSLRFCAARSVAI